MATRKIMPNVTTTHFAMFSNNLDHLPNLDFAVSTEPTFARRRSMTAKTMITRLTKSIPSSISSLIRVTPLKPNLPLSRRGRVRLRIRRCRNGGPGRRQRLFRPLERHDARLGRCLAPLGILHDLADIEVEPGGQLLTNRANVSHDRIANHLGPSGSSFRCTRAAPW